MAITVDATYPDRVIVAAFNALFALFPNCIRWAETFPSNRITIVPPTVARALLTTSLPV